MLVSVGWWTFFFVKWLETHHFHPSKKWLFGGPAGRYLDSFSGPAGPHLHPRSLLHAEGPAHLHHLMLQPDWVVGYTPSAVWKHPPPTKTNIWQWKNTHAFKCRVFPGKNGDVPASHSFEDVCPTLKNKVMFQPSMLGHTGGQLAKKKHHFLQLCFQWFLEAGKVPGTKPQRVGSFWEDSPYGPVGSQIQREKPPGVFF